MKRFALLLLLAVTATAKADQPALSAAVPAFDPAIPTDEASYSTLGVFPKIREVEALLWAFGLRKELDRTGAWETVRVVPEQDIIADIVLRGSIVESDGLTFAFSLRVEDASGNTWFENTYRGTTNGAGNGFVPVFAAAARDVANAQSTLSIDERQRIHDIAMLRYAKRLAPSAFGDYLETTDSGRIELKRLPARDDPMLNRIERVRATEFVVEDTIDEKFAELSDEVGSVYRIWRDYRRQNVDYQKENQRRAQFDNDEYPQASFERFKRLYDLYKWDRQTVQEQDQLALAFDNEVSPILKQIELRVTELERFVDSKNAEWYRLLEALFEVESGL